MLQLALPHINVISKVDLVEKFGDLSFNIDYFCEVLDLSFLLERIDDDPFTKQFKKLNEALCSVIEDYSLGEMTLRVSCSLVLRQQHSDWFF